jgi:hypothetical protein
MRHEVARTVVCYGYIVNKPAVPSAASIGTGVTGNGRVGSCQDNVPPPARCGNNREVISVAASVKAVGGLDGMTRPIYVNCRKHRQASTSQRRCQAPTKTVRSQVAGLQYAGTRIPRLPVYRQGLNHPSLFEWNMVNPISLLFGGRPTARKVDGMRGNGTLEKANAAR